MSAPTKGKDPMSKSNSRRAPNVALFKFVAEMNKSLDKAEAQLGESKPLTGTEKRRAAKFRKGGEHVIQTVGALGKQYALDSESLRSDSMLGKLDESELLLQLLTRFEQLHKRVGDDIFRARGTAWQQAREFYALLQTRAKADGEVAKNLAPIAQYFAYRNPEKKRAAKRQRKEVASADKTLERVEPTALAPSAEPQPKPNTQHVAVSGAQSGVVTATSGAT